MTPKRLIYDSPTTVHPGDYIRSHTTGRTWLVHTSRTAQRGQHAGTRQTLTVTVVPHDHPDPGDVIHDLVWKPKPRKRV